jgi:heparosan-N-sulfate-glucuronate 5-epimerase
LASTPPAAPREAGFLSSARSLALYPGQNVVPGEVRGYHIDLRVKAHGGGWDPNRSARHAFWVITGQWGLGAYERYLAGEGDQWLDTALQVGRFLLERQRDNGGWAHDVPFPHTYRLRPPWLSAMAQGEAASVLVRLHAETGDEAFADAARRALLPMSVPSEAGGVRATLGGGAFLEEYPTTPSSHVLNGAFFAVWGCYDVWKALGDDAAGALFDETLGTLAANIERWDTGFWSRYDLYPHPIANVASSMYHVLHLSQLEATARIAPRPELAAALERWRGYTASRSKRARAFAQKAAFRLVVPRNPRLAALLPWTRG